MDAAIHFLCDLPEWTLRASVLLQAKRQEPGVPFSATDHYRLSRQVEAMLDATPEAFVLVYSKVQGICAFPAASASALGSQDLFDIGFSPWRTFLAGLFRGRFGDPRPDSLPPAKSGDRGPKYELSIVAQATAAEESAMAIEL